MVIGASYAPLLVNVNAPSWPTNLIGYNGLTSYGSPSYWVVKMLSDGHGRRVVGATLRGSGNLSEVASHSPGHTYVVLVNNGGATANTTVRLVGLRGGAKGGTATVLAGNPTTQNSLADPDLIAPKTAVLRSRGTSFKYLFPAHSVTVLNLRTA